MMKKRLATVLFAALLCFAPLISLALVSNKPMEAFYVNDYAEVIDAANEAQMLELGALLEDLTGAQVVAVTVPFLDGMEEEEYSAELFNKWQLGQKDKNNGVLLLLSVGDRAVHVTVGTGLEREMPPSVTGKFLDHAKENYLADNKFSLGIIDIYTALCNKAASVYGVSLAAAGGGTAEDYDEYGYEYDYAYDYGYQDSYHQPYGGTSFLSTIVVIVVLIIALSIVRSIFSASGAIPGCMFGWLLGGGRRRHYGRRHYHRPPPPPPPPFGGPRHRPPGGRSTGGFGGFGGFGGGGGSRPGGGSRSGGGSRPSGPRSGGGGKTRGGGAGRKF